MLLEIVSSSCRTGSTRRVTVKGDKLSGKYFSYLNDTLLFHFPIFSPGDASVNASNNWWGAADINVAYGRVYDFHQDSSLLMVNITPVLTERRIDCSDVNNCSSNGECVSPNRCRCFSGKYKFVMHLHKCQRSGCHCFKKQIVFWKSKLLIIKCTKLIQFIFERPSSMTSIAING